MSFGETKEQGDRVVVLLEPPDQKIAVIKALRCCAAIGLKDAKELIERAPTPLLAYVAADQADILYKQLIEAGARVSIEPLDRYTESQLTGIPNRYVPRPPAAGCMGVGAGGLLAGLIYWLR